MFHITSNGPNGPNPDPPLPNGPDRRLEKFPTNCLDRAIPTDNVSELTNSNIPINQLPNYIPSGTLLTSRGTVAFPSNPPSLSQSDSSNYLNKWSIITFRNGTWAYVYLFGMSNLGLSGFVLYSWPIMISIFIPIQLISQIYFI